ncbi:MAG: hypothetical protein FJ096_14070 [Deltaproteobacteria bacterium]|nr:hypothetical protein [Deltaproteobacteria bacterium]
MTNWMRGILVVAASGAVACGGTTADESGSGGASADMGQTSSASSGSGSSGSGESATGGGTGATSGGGAQCTAASVNMDDPCEVCVVTSCTAEALACCQNEGCLDIVACAQETGCSGADCYQPETCQKVIDDAGGIQIAVGYAAPLGECAFENCATECGQGG